MKPRRWVLYPLLIGPYPAIALYAQNARGTPLVELMWPLALSTAASIVVWLVLFLIVREAARAAMLTVLAVTVFATIAAAPGWVDWGLTQLSAYWIITTVHVWPPLVVTAELLLAIGLVYAVARLKEPRGLTPSLNVFALILIAMPVYTIAHARREQQVEVMEAKGGIFPPGAVSTAQLVGRRPDIYYIILDGYARADVMAELFGFDNEPFLKRLQQKGFYVAKRSTANYCQTPLSLSSSLNAVYLNDLIPADSHDKEQLNRWTGEGSIVQTLRGLGYRFVTFATGFDETEHPKAEVYLSPFAYVSPFHRLLLDHTPLSRLMPAPIMGDAYSQSRARTLHALETLPQIASSSEPTFTFAHIVSPHPPFVFGENGEDVGAHDKQYFLTDGEFFRAWYGDRKVYVDGYRKQARFLTAQVERMIDRLLASNSEPPVIILQSDHGSGLGLSTGSAAETDMHERMSILNAYYLPDGKGNSPLYQSISPVNSFRVVLNTYFDADLELLPDRSYYSTWGEPFKFVDVTDKVRLPSDTAPESACKAEAAHRK
jgi:Sulfatase